MTSRKERKKENLQRIRKAGDQFAIDLPIGEIIGTNVTGFIRTRNGKDFSIKFCSDYSDDVYFDKASLLKKLPCIGRQLHFLTQHGWKSIKNYIYHLTLLNRLVESEELLPNEVSRMIKGFAFPIPEIIEHHFTYENLYTPLPPVFH